MYLAILHLSGDSPASSARQAYLQQTGHGVYHTHLNRAASSTLKEFPADVAIVELGDRAAEALVVVEALLAVPRRRGDDLPLVLVEVSSVDRGEVQRVAPHAVVLAPGCSAQDAEEACRQAYGRLLGE